MKQTLALALLAASLPAAAVAQGAADEAAIRALQQQQASAWNAHDIDAYAGLFTEGADVINVLGWHWSMSGALSPTGAASDRPEAGIQTVVVTQRGGIWRIADFQNTSSQPERAFPGSK